jgi:hypothetical protein
MDAADPIGKTNGHNGQGIRHGSHLWKETAQDTSLRGVVVFVGGRHLDTDCANFEGIFRIVRSIPSRQAEPFKRWLARMGRGWLRDLEGPVRSHCRTREISKAKDQNTDNLRGHTTGLEQIFSMIADAATQEIAEKMNAHGFEKNKVADERGSMIADQARERLKKEIGERVVPQVNYLKKHENRKRISAKG